MRRMERLTPDRLKEIQKNLDQGIPVPREDALALLRELLIVRALVSKWADTLRDSENPRFRWLARALLFVVNPGDDDEHHGQHDG